MLPSVPIAGATLIPTRWMPHALVAGRALESAELVGSVGVVPCGQGRREVPNAPTHIVGGLAAGHTPRGRTMRLPPATPTHTGHPLAALTPAVAPAAPEQPCPSSARA